MTKNIESILVPINDGSTSLAAFALAKKFAPETIELFHEVNRWPSFVDDILFPYAGLGEDRAGIEHEILKQAKTYYEKKFKIKKENNLHLNFLDVESTKAKLQSSSADLVILGDDAVQRTKGSIGPYTERLINMPLKPTLVVRHKPEIKKIVVAIDLSQTSAHILNFAAQVAIQMKAEMETLVVIPDGNDDVRELLQLNTGTNRKKLIGKCRSRIDAMFERTTQSQELKFGTYDLFSPKLKRKKILVGEPSNIILQHAERSDADLIIVGTSRESARVGSVAHRVLRNSPTNVLVVN